MAEESIQRAPLSSTTVRWVNPIGIDRHDAPIAQLLRGIKHADTQVEVVSFEMNFTPPHLEYRSYEALMVRHIVDAARDAALKHIDAMVIGCFYDPALEDAREISGETVVVAPCLSTLTLAAQLANRFSILVGRHKWIEQMSDRVCRYGMRDRLASFRSLGMGVDDFQLDHQVTRGRIIDEARRAVRRDHAEAVILGCTIEYGFFQEVQAAVGVPVIDAVIAPFKHAEHLAQMKRKFGWKPSRVGSCEPPPEDELLRAGLFQNPLAMRRTLV